MSNIAKGILIMVIAFKFFHIRVQHHSMKVTRAMIEGHLLMKVFIVMELAALIMELLRPACELAILMMVAGTFIRCWESCVYGKRWDRAQYFIKQSKKQYGDAI